MAYEDGLVAAVESFRNSEKSRMPYPLAGVHPVSGAAQAPMKTPPLVECGKLRAAHFFNSLLENQRNW